MFVLYLLPRLFYSQKSESFVTAIKNRNNTRKHTKTIIFPLSWFIYVIRVILMQITWNLCVICFISIMIHAMQTWLFILNTLWSSLTLVPIQPCSHPLSEAPVPRKAQALAKEWHLLWPSQWPNRWLKKCPASFLRCRPKFKLYPNPSPLLTPRPIPLSPQPLPLSSSTHAARHPSRVKMGRPNCWNGSTTLK